ncbi:MAG: c-type cytochrome, partial [Thermoanaerobaculia bacterium]|nr:c-type cytochrome [Thermoanaerobaculia bacterium]
MSRRPPALPIAALVAVCLAQPLAAAAPAFTEAQAAAGASAYRRHCASCHGRRLEGIHLSPGLEGETFDRRWRGRTLDRLMVALERMPPEPSPDAASLGSETYAGIAAFLLRSNGHEAGDVELPTDPSALAELTIPLREGESFDPDAPVIASPADSPRLAALTPVTGEMLRDPPPGDWLQWGRTYDGLGYSPLEIIDRGNVAELDRAWRLPLRDGTSMAMPVVHDGVVFLQTIP